MHQTHSTSLVCVVEFDDSDRLPDRLASGLQTSSVVHLTGVPDVHLGEFYSKLSGQIGKIVLHGEETSGERTYERWTKIEFLPEKQDVFRHSATRQPLHTDNAYTTFEQDVIFFYCVRPAAVGGATTFIDGPLIVDLLKAYEPGLFQRLTTHDVVFGKGADETRVQKIISIEEGHIVLNWNYFRVDEKKNSPPILEMCDEFHRFCEGKLVDGGLPSPVCLKERDAVFFHDRRVLHGRNSFFGDRCLVKGGLLFE